jgi:hypothetical protein
MLFFYCQLLTILLYNKTWILGIYVHCLISFSKFVLLGWPWKSIGFQTLPRTTYVPSLVKIHWRILILECSQGCYVVKIWPGYLWPWKSILGTYLDLKRIWNPIDFQGQRSRSQGLIFRRGDTPRFALPLFIFTVEL